MLVLVTLSMVAILGVAAIAIDLGNGYSTSRKTQNASDDAALAATRALACYEFQNPSSPNYSAQNGDPYASCTPNVGVDPSTIDTIAQTVATSDNGTQQYTCSVITSYDPATYTTAPYYKVIAPCSQTGSWDTDPTAAGVFVSAKSTQTTSFGRAAGTPNLAETRQAAATIQELINPATNGIILVCGGVDGTPQQVDPITGLTVPQLVNYNPATQEYSLNTTKADPTLTGSSPTYNGPVYNPSWGDGTNNPATGQQYGQPVLNLHDSNNTGGVDSCNLVSSGFHGVDENPITIPGWNTISTGDKAGPVSVSIAGEPGCSASDLSSNPAGCYLVLPICTASNSKAGSKGSMYCVAWGAFELLNPKVGGKDQQYFGFTGVATVSSGGTATGGPNGKVVNVIQLVQ